MIPEIISATLLIIPPLAMIPPCMRYWSEYKKERTKGPQGRKADYNRPFFCLLVIGVFSMWIAWAGGIVFLFLNKYRLVFGALTFSSPHETSLRIIGFLIFYLGAVTYYLTIIVAGKYLRPAPSGTLDHHRLVRKGPFALIRHPLYVSYILVLAGLSLVLLNCWLLIPTLFMVVGIYPTARAEETVLMAQFGDEYTKYRQEIGMFFPKAR